MGTRTTKAKPKAAPAGALSLRQVAPVLVYQDEAMTPDGVPPRDLTVADLVRIHRVRALFVSAGQPVEPATADELEALATELSSAGAFERVASSKASARVAVAVPVEVAAPVEDVNDQASEEPASPADEGAPA